MLDPFRRGCSGRLDGLVRGDPVAGAQVWGAIMKLNERVFPCEFPYRVEESQRRFDAWWAFAESQALHEPEYLLPTARVESDFRAFTFELTAPVSKSEEELASGIAEVGPWAYQIEFPKRTTTTLGFRDPRDWRFHRYRGSLLVRTLVSVLGEDCESLSLLDVGCHCGVFSLEAAYLGFARVRGIDLREQNVRQARWLAETFGIPNAEFEAVNVRDLARVVPADVTLCGGLLYHVTFPVELVRDLYASCNEFLVLDCAAAKDPVSTFFLVMHKNTTYSAEGESHYEFQPTYRALVDLLMSVGFETVIEVVGSRASEVWGYQEGITRTFLAFKPGSRFADRFKEALGVA